MKTTIISKRQTCAAILMLAGVFASAAATNAGQSPLPEDQTALSTGTILRKMVAHYSGLNSIQVKINSSTVMPFNGQPLAMKGVASLALQRPDLYPLRTYAPPAPVDSSLNGVVYYTSIDGRRIVVYERLLKRYTSGPAMSLAELAAQSRARVKSPKPPVPGLLLTLFTDSPAGQATQRFLGDVTVVGRKTMEGTPVEVLEFFPMTSRAAAQSKSFKFFIAVEIHSGRLMQETTIFHTNYTITVTAIYRTISENKPFPISMFIFRPPKGVKLVHKFVYPYGDPHD